MKDPYVSTKSLPISALNFAESITISISLFSPEALGRKEEFELFSFIFLSHDMFKNIINKNMVKTFSLSITVYYL